MNLSKIQALQNVTQSQGVASAKRLEQIMEQTQSANLSEAEQKMIQQEFPVGQNQKLHLYMSSGSSKMEQPDARGNNFDFRI